MSSLVYGLAIHCFSVLHTRGDKNAWTFRVAFDPNIPFLSNVRTTIRFLLALCLQSFIALSLTVKKKIYMDERRRIPLSSRNSLLTFMASGKNFDVYLRHRRRIRRW